MEGLQNESEKARESCFQSLVERCCGEATSCHFARNNTWLGDILSRSCQALSSAGHAMCRDQAPSMIPGDKRGINSGRLRVLAPGHGPGQPSRGSLKSLVPVVPPSLETSSRREGQGAPHALSLWALACSRRGFCAASCSLAGANSTEVGPGKCIRCCGCAR
ncbi:hypothetical protein BU26DRAFT_284829 [Trematosphaeria pertusa]|uniref:Uncharacterized protein n=1 Tax=Trematosphaeria pertusa TaxID=390896 RepID=A0A6A6IPJ7_9PLEO|nr:uncharacterized protein BU26DRAFT_284829 [Trematosphaeria pertusa]KAF2251510.1 hypothetical protein BU26DRAFT_284829 [Trematosphaeria pertusa]